MKSRDIGKGLSGIRGELGHTVALKFAEDWEHTMFKHGWVAARAKVIDASFGDVIQAGPLIYANYVIDDAKLDALPEDLEGS
ncbi:MAG: hypothetical protein U0990_00745 [Candidatus Nanopelagicales bacterium]|nr:hypothetical protein [Candidatus Nanopelagicales bacterium]MDZ4248603.1 hypothetical protein [Candidatus Nanopelagicales bacterium]